MRERLDGPVTPLSDNDGYVVHCHQRVPLTRGFPSHQGAMTPLIRLVLITPQNVGMATKKRHPRAGVALYKWSRGELNPGPVTVPSFFYVRSLLATEGDFSAPINIADNRWRA